MEDFQSSLFHLAHIPQISSCSWRLLVHRCLWGKLNERKKETIQQKDVQRPVGSSAVQGLWPAGKWEKGRGRKGRGWKGGYAPETEENAIFKDILLRPFWHCFRLVLYFHDTNTATANVNVINFHTPYLMLKYGNGFISIIHKSLYLSSYSWQWSQLSNRFSFQQECLDHGLQESISCCTLCLLDSIDCQTTSSYLCTLAKQNSA